MEDYLAHIRRDLSGRPIAVQTVRQHCHNTAEYAAQALEPVSLSASGYLAGLVHDAGKYTAGFQNYLAGQIGQRGSVNHTFAGVRLLLERYFSADPGDFSGVASELIIAEGTAKAHTRHIYEKLGINTRQELLDLLMAES